MRVALAVVMLAACQAEAPDDYPVGVGSGGPGGNGSGNKDAATPDDDGGSGGQIIGRVCVLSDLRVLDGCAASGAGGIAVTLGGEATTTADNGAFAIATPAGSNLVWHAGAPGYITSVVPFTTRYFIPILRDTDYFTLLQDNGMLLADTQGSLVARVVQNDLPAADAIAAIDPVSQFAPRYDGTSAALWDQDATGPRGLTWITGIAAGSASVRVTPSGSTTATTTIQSIEPLAITFVTIEIP
ncbi:MAG TPA: hypothetical protein VFQ53_16795 [Kofleriaceae bacterium]|nr:hypothetical protein [Kofleriaceae bacterium]